MTPAPSEQVAAEAPRPRTPTHGRKEDRKGDEEPRGARRKRDKKQHAARLPVIVVSILLVALGAGAYWMLTRNGEVEPGAGGGAAPASSPDGTTNGTQDGAAGSAPAEAVEPAKEPAPPEEKQADSLLGEDAPGVEDGL